jgi:protoheme IX farnesyltransferase
MQLTRNAPASWRHIALQYFALTKPRVVLLAAFCALIGMLLATDGPLPWQLLIAGIAGISLLAGAGFAFNCLIERSIDARMARTRARPLARGEVGVTGTIVFAGIIGGLGAALLYWAVNPLTMWLTMATFIGYAVIYTVFLKPATPQNIVIGGASGAMPPVLGWAAVANEVTAPALVLFLIIFVWTPPMLPVTHGPEFTRLNVLLYTVLLVAVSVMPFMIHMSGYFYLLSALALGGVFLWYAWRLWRSYSDALARRTFSYSIFYLSALFGALLIDHYLR